MRLALFIYDDIVGCVIIADIHKINISQIALTTFEC